MNSFLPSSRSSKSKYLKAYPHPSIWSAGSRAGFALSNTGGKNSNCSSNPCFTLLSSYKSSLTPLLHEDEEVIQELFPFRVTIQFIELLGRNKNGGTIHKETDKATTSASSNGHLVFVLGQPQARKDKAFLELVMPGRKSSSEISQKASVWIISLAPLCCRNNFTKGFETQALPSAP